VCLLQAAVSAKYEEGPSAVKEWSNEALLDKTRTRVLELEASLKQVRTHLLTS